MRGTTWTREENKGVSKDYKSGLDYKTSAAKYPRLTLRSVKAKYGNCKHLDGKGGLRGVSIIHREVWLELMREEQN